MYIGIFTLKGEIIATVPDRTAEPEMAMDFLSLFGVWNEEKNSFCFGDVQIWNALLKRKVMDFVDKYSGGENKGAYILIQTLNKLQEEDKFICLILNRDVFTEDERTQIYLSLRQINGDENIFEVFNSFKNEFKELIELYSIKVVRSGDSGPFGEKKRENRKCIYCDKTQKDGVTFKKKGHAISEALGNKLLVQYEECDICNGKFGDSIEKDFANYVAPFRVFYKVQGKEGVPKYKKGKDVFLENEDGSVVITEQSDDLLKRFSGFTNLEFPEKIQLNYIYKALVKFCLGCQERNNLIHFRKTISWLNDLEGEYIQLPKVAVLLNYENFALEPCLTIYSRKNNDYDMPSMVGEFQFLMFKYSFIIPFSDNDRTDFCDDEAFMQYWSRMKHYHKHENWVFRDYSDNTKKDLVHKFHFVQVKDLEQHESES